MKPFFETNIFHDLHCLVGQAVIFVLFCFICFVCLCFYAIIVNLCDMFDIAIYFMCFFVVVWFFMLIWYQYFYILYCIGMIFGWGLLEEYEIQLKLWYVSRVSGSVSVSVCRHVLRLYLLYFYVNGVWYLYNSNKKLGRRAHKSTKARIESFIQVLFEKLWFSAVWCYLFVKITLIKTIW